MIYQMRVAQGEKGVISCFAHTQQLLIQKLQ